MSSVRSSAAPGRVDIPAAMDLLARRPSWLSEPLNSRTVAAALSRHVPEAERALCG
jgi:hypothetical protein